MKRFLSSVLLISVILSISFIPLGLSMIFISLEKARAETGIKESNNNKVETARVEEFPSFAGLVEKLEPSVVNISATRIARASGFNFQTPFGEKDPFEEFFKNFFGEVQQQEYRQQGLGSGFIISEDGYIVTNNHRK